MAPEKWLYKPWILLSPKLGGGGRTSIPTFIWRNKQRGIAMKDLKGSGMTGQFYQLSNIIINTKIHCVAGEGIVDGLVRGSDLKSQRKNVPILTRTLNPRDR